MVNERQDYKFVPARCREPTGTKTNSSDRAKRTGCGEPSFFQHRSRARENEAEIPQLWPVGGLIAGGSGIVSTAAIKSNRHINQMAYLRFNESPNQERPLTWRASQLSDSNIVH